MRGERINIGVVVVGDDPPFFEAKLIPRTDRGRLSKMGFGTDFSFLDALSKELAASVVPEGQMTVVGGPWTHELLQRAHVEWANTVQITDLRAAVHARPTALVEALYGELVADPSARRHRARDRRWIRRRALARLRQGLQVPGLDFDAHVVRDIKVQGALETHKFDIRLQNGHTIGLIQGLALEGIHGRSKEIEALAWTIDDVRKHDSTVPVSVLSVGEGPILDRAEHIYDGLGAQFVRESELDSWLDNAASSLIATTVP